MDNLQYLGALRSQNSFSRGDLRVAMNDCGMHISEASFKSKLQWLINSGNIVRVGRNAYCVPSDGMKKYSYKHSELSEDVAGRLQENHPYLDFTVFELVQLNEFVNHQLAHNALFVSVEGALGGFVFDTLKAAYPGKVLLNPNAGIYHQYWSSDMIAIRKLITESPKDRENPWAARLEKILVDLVADPLLSASVSESEHPGIYRNAFHKYAVDESCLFRYAKRRGSDGKIYQLIAQAGLQLRTRRQQC